MYDCKIQDETVSNISLFAEILTSGGVGELNNVFETGFTVEQHKHWKERVAVNIKCIQPTEKGIKENS
jgi:predicted transposase YbfD/YdcC